MKIKNLFQYIWKNKNDFVILAIFFAVFNYFLDTESAVLWAIFLAFARFEWDNRIVGGVAIFWLATCPLMLYLQLDAAAEQFAVYAYFFLVMTVVLQIIEYFKYPNRFKD